MNRTFDTNTIYKDPLNKKLTGVCAGIARHYGDWRSLCSDFSTTTYPISWFLPSIQ
jgi:hypothetical protein